MTAPIELTDTQRDQIIRWFTSHLPDGSDAAKAAADAGAELDRVDAALREAGIEYPLGARGVRDLANQRDGADEARDEALLEAQQLRGKLEEAQRIAAQAGKTAKLYQVQRDRAVDAVRGRRETDQETS